MRTLKPRSIGESRSKKKQGPSPSEWEKYKETIRQFYIIDDLPLRDVIRMMRMKFDFDAEPGMYKARFRNWQFQKYNREQVMQAIVRKLIERDRQGKTTIVRLDGKEIKRREVMRYLNRKGIKNMFDAFDSGGLVASATPGGLTLQTPAPFAGNVSLRGEDKSLILDEKELTGFLDMNHELPDSRLDCDAFTLPAEIDNFLHSEMRDSSETLDLDLLQVLFDGTDLLEVPGPSHKPPAVQQQPTSPEEQVFKISDKSKEQSPIRDHLTSPSSKTETVDDDDAYHVFGNSPLHEAILNAEGSPDLIRAMYVLVSQGESWSTQNNAGITPDYLARFLGFEKELDIVYEMLRHYDPTAVSVTNQLLSFEEPTQSYIGMQRWCLYNASPSPRIINWIYSYLHYKTKGCQPASCKSNDCEWWNRKFRHQCLASKYWFPRTLRASDVKILDVSKDAFDTFIDLSEGEEAHATPLFGKQPQ